MGKRFHETDRWRDPWFRDLPNEYRWMWEYMNDSCDQAGVWVVDMALAGFMIGRELDLPTAKILFEDRITELEAGKRWFIKPFIAEQYGELVPTNNFHKSVLARLERHGVRGRPAPDQPLTESGEGHKTIQRQRDVKTLGEKSAEKRGFVPPTPQEATEYARSIGYKLDGEKFVAHYAARGWKYGGGQPMKDWRAAIVTWKKKAAPHELIAPVKVRPPDPVISDADMAEGARVMRETMGMLKPKEMPK